MVTETASAVLAGAPAPIDWVLPAAIVTVTGLETGLIVSEKVALKLKTLAVTVNRPADELTVKAGAVASPLALLTLVETIAPLKLPLSPVVPG